MSTSDNETRWMPALPLGLLAGALGGAVLVKVLSATPRMPNIGPWQQALIEQRGEVEGAMLAARVQARYDELYTQRPHFADRALRMHLEDHILPGLALYQVLQNDRGEPESALSEVDRLFEAGLDKKLVQLRLLGRLPAPFAAFRLLARWSMREFPAEGWAIELVEDSKQSYAFTIRRCFYLDVLTAYGAPELTASFCRLDDLLCANLPPPLRFERTKTLGRGDDCCDFRYVRLA